jgi:hypothetical protein
MAAATDSYDLIFHNLALQKFEKIKVLTGFRVILVW